VQVQGTISSLFVGGTFVTFKKKEIGTIKLLKSFSRYFFPVIILLLGQAVLAQEESTTQMVPDTAKPAGRGQ